jgi:pSer/pThr/pTyr-binding forkhead associated (FHA) protein
MEIITPSGQRFTLREGENLIGRGSDCALRLDAELVSRRHVSIFWDGRQAVLRDMGSTNGTWLDGRRLEPGSASILLPGSVIELGGAEVRLELRETGTPVAPVPVVSLPPPVAPRRALPIWLWILGGVAVLLLLFAATVLVTRKLAEKTPAVEETMATEVTPEWTPAAPPTPAGSGFQPTATPLQAATAALIPSPAVPAPVIPTPAVPAPKAGAGAAAGLQMPPINPTSMPQLAASLVGEFAPEEVRVTLATLMPGLVGGTPGAPLPGNLLTPAPPLGAQRYGAPVLKGPASGSNFEGEGNPPILEWEPVQGLRPNDYYRVIVFYKPANRELAGGTWMKGTSYVVPAWFLSQHSGRFEWQVVVSEATGLPENGGKLGATVSDPSERRWFIWNAGDGGSDEAPTPSYDG